MITLYSLRYHDFLRFYLILCSNSIDGFMQIRFQLLNTSTQEWIPVTKLGRLVKDGKIKSLEEIYLFSLPIKVDSLFS